MATARTKARGRSSDELAVIAQRAQAFTNASGAAIALSEGNAAEIICRARAGSSAPEVGTALRVEGTFTGLCIQSGKELRCDDSETDTRVDKAAIRALGIRSMVAIPIKENGGVVGVLAVFAPTAHAFNITHVGVLKTMAEQIAACLHRTQRDEAHSPEPLPAPPVKTAAAVSAAASPVPPPAVAIKAAEAALRHRQLPVVPKVESVRDTRLAEEIDPAPFRQIRQKEQTNSHVQHKEYKTYFPGVFETPNAAAAPKNRPGANVFMIGAFALVVLGLAVGLSFKLRRPAAASPPALETSSSPGTPATPATPTPASANVQPPAKNIALAPPANREEAQPKSGEAQPKREEIVALSAAPSRISRARDNSVPASDAPAISLDSVPASEPPSSLISPASQPTPRFLTTSELATLTVIKKVPPVYPEVAKQHRLSGIVVVQGIVDKNGRISDLQLISGSPLFREAAFAAVKQWVFKPARLNGQTIVQPTRIRLDFGVQ